MAAAVGKGGGASASPPEKGRGGDDNNNKEVTLLCLEGSKLPLEEFMREWNARILRRVALLQKNGRVQYDEFEKLVKARKLDSNLKKCTAFVRKMRQFQDSQRSAIETDIRTLNLTKYISEIALVIVELRLKPADIPSLVAVCSEIHARYRDFSHQLLQNFRTFLTVTDLNSNPKLSTDLRLFTELSLAGILPASAAVPFLLQTVQRLTTLDKDGRHLFPVLVTLLRDVTDELVGVLPRDVRVALEEHVCPSQLSRSPNLALKSEEQVKLKGILKKYFIQNKAVFTKKNDKVWGSAKYLRKLLETKGEVPPARQKSHDELLAELEKHHSNLGKLANLLDLQTPKMRYLSVNPDEEFEQALDNAGEDGTGPAEGVPLFEDEETRQFYQDLPDLIAYMFEKKNGLIKPRGGSSPGDVAVIDSSTGLDSEKDTEEDKSDASSETGDSSSSEEDPDSDSSDTDSDFDLDTEKAELQDITEEISPSDLDSDILPSLRDASGSDSHEDLAPSGNRSKLTLSTYLKNLKECVNKAMIDQAACDFVDHFKSRKCQRELSKQLFTIPRQRMDLLRLFARLTATISQIYPDVGSEMCDLLRKDFRFLVLKRDQHRLDAKLRVTRYIAELTIFSVFPKNEAFNCLKMLLRNFSHHQIEMTCCFLETCGRFLHRSRDSHRRMKLYLDEMLRRKTSQFLEPCYAYKVDAAYHTVCPPVGHPTPKNRKSPLHAFLEYVLIFDLNRDTLERANQVLRKFDWQDPAKKDLVIVTLSSPWRLNYSQLDPAAALVASLKPLRPSVVQAILENISEVVRLGCEFESEDINNMRMSTCQYFAHLFNYKCVSTTSLLNVMYYLISYGTTYQSQVFSSMDPPDSLYRIRVICHMLRIMGEYMATPKSNRRLDFFLKYFQRYFLYKKGLSVWEENAGRKRFPHYVEEMFEDTIRRVRGKWNFVRTMEEAEAEIVELDKRLREKVKNDSVKRAISGERKAVGVKIPGGGGMEARKPGSYSKAMQQRRNEEEGKGEETTRPLEGIEEEAGEEEDDFEKEFRALCVDVTTVGPLEKQGGGFGGTVRKTDVPVAKVGGAGESGMDALSYGSLKVKVTVLTKQNNKPKEKTLEIETKEDFLVSIRAREEKEKRELQEVKRRTLQLSRIQQEEEQREKDRTMMQALQKLGNVAVKPISGGGKQRGHFAKK